MEQEQPGRVGRRLAAIVAADVAGYSRLMGLDEVGTARALREHRKVTDALVAPIYGWPAERRAALPARSANTARLLTPSLRRSTVGRRKCARAAPVRAREGARRMTRALP